MTGTTSSARILVVEDDLENGQLLLDLLTFEGYPAQLVRTGREAIHVLQTAPRPRALIVDYVLPDMSGVDLLEATVAQRQGIPVLVVSASQGVLERTRDLDSTWVGLKPFELDELLAHLTAGLRRSEP